MIRPIHLLLLSACLALAACGGEDRQAERARLAAEAADKLPDDLALSALYERSCIACHTTVDSGAPIVGDRTDWNKRFEAGAETVLMNTVSGIRAMPPRGSCLDCSVNELAGLVAFLAGRPIDADTVSAVEARAEGIEP